MLLIADRLREERAGLWRVLRLGSEEGEEKRIWGRWF